MTGWRKSHWLHIYVEAKFRTCSFTAFLVDIFIAFGYVIQQALDNVSGLMLWPGRLVSNLVHPG